MWCDFTVLHVLYLTSCLMYLSFLVVSPSHSFPPICISICIIPSKLCQTPPHIRTLLQLSILGQAVISCLTCLCQLSLSPPLLKDSARMFHYYLYPNLQRAVRYSFFLFGSGWIRVILPGFDPLMVKLVFKRSFSDFESLI